MKKLLGATALIAAGLIGYFLVTGRSTQEDLIALLREVAGPDATVTVDGCDMFIQTEVAGADGSGLSRVVLRADMRDYDFETVRLNSGPDSVTLRASRKDTTSAMLNTLNDVLDRLEMTSTDLEIDRDTLRDLLAQQNGAVSFRVMAEVIVDDDENTLVAHEDAPAFFEFAQLVEALPAPASYRSITAYAPGEPSVDTFRTGEITVVPILAFTLPNQEDINQLGQALFNHAVSSGCD